MNRLFYAISLLAFASFSFVSCQKEPTPVNEDGKLVTVTFTADKTAIATKTAAVVDMVNNSVSYIWTNEDINNIKLFSVTTTTNDKDEEIEVLTEVSNPTVSKTTDGSKLTISATVSANSSYKFRAILCDPTSYTGSGSNYSERKPKIKVKQNPNGYENFDPTADILVSDDLNVVVGETGASGNMEMSFRRQVVINKMTLKNLTPGEKVSKVVVTSTTKDIQGYLNNGAMSGQSKVITLEYNDVEVPSSGEFPVYFVSMNNEGIALKIDVTTDAFNYTKSFASGKSIDLTFGVVTMFGIPFSDSDKTAVTSLPDGTYFITGVHDSQVYAAKKYVSGNNLSNPIEIDVDEQKESIGYVNDIEDCIFTFTRITEGDFVGKYTIQDAGGKYLYAAGGNANNYLKGENAPDEAGNAYWTVNKNGNSYDIESAGNASRKIMRFNFNDGSPIFSCYGAGQTAVTLYPASWCILNTTPYISINETERTKTALFSANSVVFNYIANQYAPTPSVTIASDPNSIIKESPVVSNGTITVTLNPNTENVEKTATLIVSGEGLDSDVTLTINQEAKPNNVFSYSFTSKSWAATRDGNEENWKSGKDGYQFSNDNKGIQVTAAATGANGTSPYSFTSVSKVVVIYCTNENSGAGSISVKVGNGTAISSSVTKTGGTTARTLEFAFNPAESGKVTITVDCTANSIFLIGADITAELSTTYSITCATGLANGSIEANKDAAYAGDEITLTATPAEGYQLGEWTVTEATSGAAVTVTNGIFTMPSDNVNVTATFEKQVVHHYVKVTSNSDITDGDYLIVYENGGVAFNGGLTSFDAVGNTVGVTISDNKIEATASTNAAKFTISSVTGGYSIRGASGKYIGVASYSNGLTTNDNAVVNGIDVSNGNASITVAFDEGPMTLKYNSASNQTRFRYYKSGQQAIQLYKLN